MTTAAEAVIGDEKNVFGHLHIILRGVLIPKPNCERSCSTLRTPASTARTSEMPSSSATRFAVVGYPL